MKKKMKKSQSQQKQQKEVAEEGQEKERKEKEEEQDRGTLNENITMEEGIMNIDQNIWLQKTK